MTEVHILYGTESGNAEMVADDIAAALNARGIATTIRELSDVTATELADLDFAVVITSTYGEGDLPETATPLHDDLMLNRPDLTGLRFGAFGLGDSAYATYNNGIDTLQRILSDLGAAQIGTTAKHDAASGEPASDLASAWATSLLTLIPA